MMSQDSFVCKLDAPEEIRAFIPKWRQSARKALQDSMILFYPVKRAGSVVHYKGQEYRIDTGIIADIGNQYTRDWLYEVIEKEIEKDLYSIGANKVYYTGMLD